MNNTACIVISCSGVKQDYPCEAQEMYQGIAFRHALAVAKRSQADIFIFSAKYGLLKPTDWIEPYSLCLWYNGNMKAAYKKGKPLPPLADEEDVLELKRKAWPILEKYQKRVYLMSAKYSEHLPAGFQPLLNLRFGPQMAWLKAADPADLGLEPRNES